jgi:CubicO group peptidase (beta-lactamase class C family)
MNRKLIYHVATLIAFPLLLAADAPAPRDLGPMLKELVEKHGVPGAVAAIVHGNDVVAIGSAGVRKLGSPPPFLATDSVHLGSDTKAMTALLAAQLIDKKQLTFATQMSEIFPDIAAEMDPAMAKVTVRDLLDHTAGLPANLDWWTFDRTHAELPVQRRQAVAKSLSAPPASTIGKFAYSNVGYVILGAIVEAKNGKPWEMVIQRDVFGPLHMGSAGFGPPGTIGKDDQPWGHIKTLGIITPTQLDNPPVIGPAGRVHCSIADWSKFISETMRGAQGKPTLVSAETFNELTTPLAGRGYAGGWGVTKRPWAGGLTLTHAGSNTNWYCTTWIAPKKDFAVLIAINYGSEPAASIADEGASKLIELNGSL